MCSIDISPLLTFSLTTRNLMSINFDFVELLLLLEYNTIDLLSQNNLSGLSMPSKIRSPVTKFATIFHDWMPHNKVQTQLPWWKKLQ